MINSSSMHDVFPEKVYYAYLFKKVWGEEVEVSISLNSLMHVLSWIRYGCPHKCVSFISSSYYL